MSGMGRRSMKNGDEYDAYTGWRKYLCWTQRPGAMKRVKRRTHKRERREAAAVIAEQVEETS